MTSKPKDKSASKLENPKLRKRPKKTKPKFKKSSHKLNDSSESSAVKFNTYNTRKKALIHNIITDSVEPNQVTYNIENDSFSHSPEPSPATKVNHRLQVNLKTPILKTINKKDISATTENIVKTPELKTNNVKSPKLKTIYKKVISPTTKQNLKTPELKTINKKVSSPTTEKNNKMREKITKISATLNNVSNMLDTISNTQKATFNQNEGKTENSSEASKIPNYSL